MGITARVLCTRAGSVWFTMFKASLSVLCAGTKAGRLRLDGLCSRFRGKIRFRQLAKQADGSKIGWFTPSRRLLPGAVAGLSGALYPPGGY